MMQKSDKVNRRLWSAIATQNGIQLSEQLLSELMATFPNVSSENRISILRLARHRFTSQPELEVSIDVFKEIATRRSIPFVGTISDAYVVDNKNNLPAHMQNVTFDEGDPLSLDLAKLISRTIRNIRDLMGTQCKSLNKYKTHESFFSDSMMTPISARILRIAFLEAFNGASVDREQKKHVLQMIEEIGELNTSLPFKMLNRVVDAMVAINPAWNEIANALNLDASEITSSAAARSAMSEYYKMVVDGMSSAVAAKAKMSQTQEAAA